jgi:hypothetical protein
MRNTNWGIVSFVPEISSSCFERYFRGIYGKSHLQSSEAVRFFGAHGGDSTAGMYVNTIDFVDIATGWTEQRTVWGKGDSGVLEQIKNIT